jgi:hypothetical protein
VLRNLCRPEPFTLPRSGAQSAGRGQSWQDEYPVSDCRSRATATCSEALATAGVKGLRRPIRTAKLRKA